MRAQTHINGKPAEHAEPAAVQRRALVSNARQRDPRRALNGKCALGLTELVSESQERVGFIPGFFARAPAGYPAPGSRGLAIDSSDAVNLSASDLIRW